MFSPSAIDGLSTLNFTQQTVGPFALLTAGSTVPGFFTLPATTRGAILGQIAAGFQPLVGYRIAEVTTQATSVAKQYSDEVQVNYSSQKLQATSERSGSTRTSNPAARSDSRTR